MITAGQVPARHPFQSFAQYAHRSSVGASRFRLFGFWHICKSSKSALLGRCPTGSARCEASVGRCPAMSGPVRLDDVWSPLRRVCFSAGRRYATKLPISHAPKFVTRPALFGDRRLQHAVRTPDAPGAGATSSPPWTSVQVPRLPVYSSLRAPQCSLANRRRVS